MTKKDERSEPVRITAVPDEASRLAPSIYSNVMRVTVDLNSATFYFFSLSPDVIDSEAVQKTLADGKFSREAGALELTLDVPSVAKLAMPVRELPGMIEAMQRLYEHWQKLNGKEGGK